ncbi:GNAT family N-acetyltransferase [Staphylococcus simiae]|uniref:GNAT family N-acetyltransferase n=1 Tax=Staphylococcus simiae TaxID=308354 RepID=UPI001A97BF95|nr:GNAT family N-acetyltransferase [Staphylococcus simiae]MBO1198944.1 GNAT family N-acetyltransferase [Staphylococcus simiae]MBO1201141.1 GNAT family N-acetyltransferase [Staphylococcus simiae]MBO1203811.1 GNAT family N-acetyltransferase [Staphylococcus simiae]MBO1210804.1 GNAT family N-acetyltransferase [Staphylococcus simiae]MBO1229465.1 GNAT family N-acetyltransferase [Staphylococcus simiae]
MFNQVINDEMLQDCFKIREEVFVHEQGVPLEHEIDNYEDNSIHLIGYDNDKPFATLRLRPIDEQTAKIERVAVLKPYRGQGQGQALMIAMENIAQQLNYKTLILNAQIQAQEFYKSLNYDIQGKVFLEEGIKHIKMVKKV